MGASCLLAAGLEVQIFLSYGSKDAGFHYLAHFFAGASAALLVMAVVAWRRGRPVRFPLLWIVIAHLFAMAPDFAFLDGAPHEHWMDVFLGHITIHFIPGANLTLFALFAGSLAAYLAILDRRSAPRRLLASDSRAPGGVTEWRRFRQNGRVASLRGHGHFHDQEVSVVSHQSLLRDLGTHNAS